MQSTWREKWRMFWLHGIPLWTTLALMFLLSMPINSAQWGYFKPNVGLICVYYWTLKRQQIFGFFCAFIIGLLMDVYSSSPLGINILLLMLTVSVTLWLAHYFQNASFGAGWFIFCLVGFGATFFKWVMLMLYFGRIINPEEVALNYLSTALFYPLIAAINVYVQKFLPQEGLNE
ncbi:MAG: rod shape-determining protein MreD [Alphaproteobacteria bacterium]|nr:rod shape-determining protein MreD [Alphaproteobacteria bacterium]